MKIKKYTTILRAGMLDMFQWRMSLFITFLGNIVYLVVIYNLWQAIYASSPYDTVNGMTFTDTMLYLVLAMTIFNMTETYVVGSMGRHIQDGSMILNLIKPMEYRTITFFEILGADIISFCMIFVPTFIIVSIITGFAIPLGVNLLLFLPALLFARVISYYIDFFVGTICLYTESTWGINMAKEVLVLLMSGAVIPLAFFPDWLRQVAEFLPFQAIYNIPLQIMLGQVTTFETLPMFGVQLFWIGVMYVISGVFWKQSIKTITINGG